MEQPPNLECLSQDELQAAAEAAKVHLYAKIGAANQKWHWMPDCHYTMDPYPMVGARFIEEHYLRMQLLLGWQWRVKAPNHPDETFRVGFRIRDTDSVVVIGGEDKEGCCRVYTNEVTPAVKEAVLNVLNATYFK